MEVNFKLFVLLLIGSFAVMPKGNKELKHKIYNSNYDIFVVHGIKCYLCTSELNPECENPTDVSQLQQYDCGDEFDMVCSKETGTANEKTLVWRACAPRNVCMLQIYKHTNCETCESDYCNSSERLKLVPPHLMLLAGFLTWWKS